MSDEPTISEEAPPVPERIITLADGRLVRVTRVDDVDIGFDIGRAGPDDTFVPTAERRGVPPVPNLDPENPPDDATLAAHILDKLTNPPPPPVPAVVSRAEFVIAARRVLGITEGDVFALLSRVPDGEDQETARDLWEHAREFKRNNSFLLGVAQLGDITSEQIDRVFRTAAALDLD